MRGYGLGKPPLRSRICRIMLKDMRDNLSGYAG
jgi:hypothetical protein